MATAPDLHCLVLTGRGCGHVLGIWLSTWDMLRLGGGSLDQGVTHTCTHTHTHTHCCWWNVSGDVLVYRKSVHEYMSVLGKLLCLSCVCYCVTLLCAAYVEPTSRRLVNLAYIAWIVGSLCRTHVTQYKCMCTNRSQSILH